MLVFRQNRDCASTAGTLIDRSVLSAPGPFTMKMVPFRAFSGLPPSAGGLKRGSRHVPVHVGGGRGAGTPVGSGSLFGGPLRGGGGGAAVGGPPPGFPKGSFPGRVRSGERRVGEEGRFWGG